MKAFGVCVGVVVVWGIKYQEHNGFSINTACFLSAKAQDSKGIQCSLCHTWEVALQWGFDPNSEWVVGRPAGQARISISDIHLTGFDLAAL